MTSNKPQYLSVKQLLQAKAFEGNMSLTILPTNHLSELEDALHTVLHDTSYDILKELYVCINRITSNIKQNIPAKTKMSMSKFISRIDHLEARFNTRSNLVKNMSWEEKYDDDVSYGDIDLFHIDVITSRICEDKNNLETNTAQAIRNIFSLLCKMSHNLKGKIKPMVRNMANKKPISKPVPIIEEDDDYMTEEEDDYDNFEFNSDIPIRPLPRNMKNRSFSLKNTLIRDRDELIKQMALRRKGGKRYHKLKKELINKCAEIRHNVSNRKAYY